MNLTESINQVLNENVVVPEIERLYQSMKSLRDKVPDIEIVMYNDYIYFDAGNDTYGDINWHEGEYFYDRDGDFHGLGTTVDSVMNYLNGMFLL